MPSEAESSTEWDTKHLRLAIDAAGVALWSWNVDTDEFTMDRHGCDLWGVPLRPSVVFEDLSAKIHPADRDRVRAAFAATRAVVGPYDMIFASCSMTMSDGFRLEVRATMLIFKSGSCSGFF